MKNQKTNLMFYAAALVLIAVMAGCASQEAAGGGGSTGDAGVIWSQDFQGAGTGKFQTDNFGSLGFDFYPAQQDSAGINIQKQEDNVFLSMNKPPNTTLGKESVFTLARQFPSPLAGSLSFEAKIRLNNSPPLADFEGSGRMSAERIIFLNDTVESGNAKPAGIKVTFNNGKILAGNAQMDYELQTWYTVTITVDTEEGTYDVAVNGEALASDIPAPVSQIRQFGLYAHTGGSGIGLDGFQVTRN